MINLNRIVPVEKIDLISLYGLILKQASANASLAAVAATDVEGDYAISSASTPLICDQPVKSIDFATGVSTATVYFVPAYTYEGFTINGAAVTPTGAVVADAATLYKAALASGAVTITKVGF